MPELPEMQALAERLEETLEGATFTGVDPLGFSALKTVVPGPDALTGAHLVRVARRGKYLRFVTDAGVDVVLHLSQAGRLDIEVPAKRTKPKGAAVRFWLDDDRAVLVREFGHERKVSWWVLAADDPGPTEGLGPEPDSEEFELLIRTGADKRRLHTMLRDQRTVAGIGRGYADDALHAAKVSPFATLAQLTPDARDRVLIAVRATMADALEAERRRTGGLSDSKLGDRFRIHNRHGLPCPDCGTPMRRISYESHEITYCAPCQTGGKVLADRRMSRLVK
ncbi:MAG: DNA-formamidopyrimidine glycosylase family protein [Acidimicrobiia bacterium]